MPQAEAGHAVQRTARLRPGSHRDALHRRRRARRGGGSGGWLPGDAGLRTGDLGRPCTRTGPESTGGGSLMSDPARILVTGHKGYIGSVMTPLLVDAGYDVAGLDTGYFDACTLVP